MAAHTAHEDFYPRPPRGGRHYAAGESAMSIVISIHALREEGDLFLWQMSSTRFNFYPRPPRGGRLTSSAGPSGSLGFLSTPSARRATPAGEDFIFGVQFLSTPSARRATSDCPVRVMRRLISIHALREEGDTTPRPQPTTPRNFYPRPPRGGRQLLPEPHPASAGISIHALREEGDRRGTTRPTMSADFYPRPPRGGRQQKQRQNLYFQTNYTTFCTNLEEP